MRIHKNKRKSLLKNLFNTLNIDVKSVRIPKPKFYTDIANIKSDDYPTDRQDMLEKLEKLVIDKQVELLDKCYTKGVKHVGSGLSVIVEVDGNIELAGSDALEPNDNIDSELQHLIQKVEDPSFDKENSMVIMNRADTGKLLINKAVKVRGVVGVARVSGIKAILEMPKREDIEHAESIEEIKDLLHSTLGNHKKEHIEMLVFFADTDEFRFCAAWDIKNDEIVGYRKSQAMPDEAFEDELGGEFDFYWKARNGIKARKFIIDKIREIEPTRVVDSLVKTLSNESTQED